MKKYNTESYKDPTTIIIFIMILNFSLCALLIYYGRLYSSDIIGIFLPMLIICLPIFFGKKFKKKFTRNAILEFDENNFTVTQFELESNLIIEEFLIPWKDIIAYRFYFDTKNTTSLTLYLRSDIKKKFIFLDHKTFEQALNQESVFSNFFNSVKRYNEETFNDKKIKTRQSFLTTPTAKFIMISEVILIIVAFTIHFYKNSFSNSYYLLLGLVLLIPQIINRVQNKNMYDKIRQLE